VRDRSGGLDLLELEFIGPGDDRPPDQLIEQHDYGNHGRQAPQNGARITVARSGLEEGAKPRQTEIAFAENKHLASHEEEPAAGDGHHRVPHKADRGERQVQLDESLPAAETVNDGCFP
jgi:hypothetical protein